MSRTVSVMAALVGGLLASTPAFAGWADFEASFPSFPCADGWMACYQDGDRVTPELASGSGGLVMPSNLRVDWFDLTSTRSFPPFGSLSDYPAGGPPAVATVDTEDTETYDTDVPPPDPRPAPVYPDPAPRPTPSPVMSRPDPAPRPTPAPMTRPDPAPSPSPMVRPDPAPAPAPSMVRPDPAPSSVRPSSVRPSSVRPDPVAAAPDPAPAPSPMVRPDPVVEPASLAPDPEPVAMVAPEPEGPVDCSNLVRLEPAAMMGKLSDEQGACLEASLAAATKQTDKDKISRILMANSWSKGDKRTWEKLVKRHLDEIDQSNPDLCYKYALYLSTKGAGRAWGVIKWADVALENRTVWVGETYKSRVYNLYKLRAAAAQSLWKDSEEKHAAAPTEDTKKAVEEARGRTKTYAREWYEYAREAGKDTTKALQLCISAAGTSEFCEG